MKKLSFNNKRFKYGTIATVITVLFVAAVVLINIIAGLVLDRFSSNIDLTKDKIYELSDQSKDFLKELKSDIEITVLMDESSLKGYGVQGQNVVQLINKYKQASDHIKVQYIDKDKNPEIITQFKKTYQGDLSTALAVVQCGDKIKPIAESEMFNYDQSSGYTSVSSNTEQAVTSAISFVTDENPIKIAVLSTESVSDISAFTTFLGSSGYEVTNIDAVTGEIPSDTSLLILNTPKNDLPKETVDKIAKFLDNDGKYGKNLMYISSFFQKETPNINALLSEYGLNTGDGRIYETNANNLVTFSNGSYGIFTDVPSSDYSKYIQNSKLKVFVPYPSPINILFTSKDSREVKILLSTSETGIVIPSNATSDTDIKSLPQSTKTIAALGTKYIYDNNSNKSSSNIFALGSADMIGSSFISQSGSYNNADYVLSIIRVMTGKETGITIPAKSLDSVSLQVPAAQAKFIVWLTVIIIPAAILICGIVIWLRRKHR